MRVCLRSLLSCSLLFGVVAEEQSSTTAKPERIPAFQVAAAGSFNLFIVNESDGVESAVRVEVGYTP